MKCTKVSCLVAVFALCCVVAASATTIDMEANTLSEAIRSSIKSDIATCAQHGNATCLTLLGAAYYWGQEFKDQRTARNLPQAERYFRRSLVVSINSRALLGLLMETTHPRESRTLLLSAANEGDIPSIRMLAHAYVDKRSDKAIRRSIRWRKRLIIATREDTAPEKTAIGMLYLELSSPEYAHALTWLHQAALADEMIAQLNLADLYAEGRGVDKDPVTAYMLYELSGSAGISRKQALASTMSSRQLIEASQKIQRWQEGCLHGFPVRS